MLREDVVPERTDGDHLGPDHYWTYQTIFVTNTIGQQSVGWLRRWGGSYGSHLTRNGRQLLRDSQIDPAATTC
jgi:hypothetical protein